MSRLSETRRLARGSLRLSDTPAIDATRYGPRGLWRPPKASNRMQRRNAFDPVRDEYAAAVDMIHSVLAATAHGLSGSSARYWLQPYTKASGDFFCTAVHESRGWYGLFADAAGHGLPAAIYALHIPALLREAVLLGMSVAEIYDYINSFLLRQQVRGEFVCCALLHVHERDVAVLNAGIPTVRLVTEDGIELDAFPSQCLPLGIEQTAGNIEARHYRLGRGERAFLMACSDGLIELDVLRGDSFWEEMIRSALSAGSDQVYDRLVAEIRRHADGVHDDISFAIVPIPLALERSVEDEKPLLVDTRFQPLDILPRIVEGCAHAVLVTDAQQRILYVNPAFSALTGYAPDEVIGRSPRLLYSDRHDPAFYAELQRSLREDDQWSGRVWDRRKDGTLALDWLALSTLRNGQGEIEYFIATYGPDQLESNSMERAGLHALHDPLTGLANRVLLNDRGHSAVTRARRGTRSMAVLFVDLDRFSSINDSLGLDIGDEILLQVSRRLSMLLRQDDTLSRYGNDEFVCLLCDIAEQRDAALVAQKLLAALGEPLHLAGRAIKVSASVGISTLSEECGSFEDMVVQAVRAMQRCKQAGGNLFRFFDAELDRTIGNHLDIEARLDEAIEAGRLEVFLQPKIDLVLGTVMGAEALVRWRDPRDGLIAPGLFIPVAEKSDLIARIGKWVLNQVCRLLAERHFELPDHFHIAVNISPKQFERGNMADEVQQALQATGAAPGRLQLEVTESTLIGDIRGVAETLDRIVGLGASIALDDFGTGYSNLASLTRLPLGTFKLDQSLVRSVDTDDLNDSVARSVWHLANGLNKQLVAEGIETCAECIHLSRIGYRVGQGYRFGKPMPQDEFFSYLSAWDGTAGCSDGPACCNCLSQPRRKIIEGEYS